MKKICRWPVFHLPLWCLAASLTGAAASVHAAAKPTLAFTNLKTGQKLSAAAFTVQGKAASKVGVSNVLCSLNLGAWAGADTGNQWTNWSAEITLIPGTNTLSACAVDNNGNHSATNTVKFIYVVTDVLTVLTNGLGTIKPNYNGAQLQIGASYSITATATQKGFGLKTWTDGSSNVIASTSTLKFIMASNLILIANFGDVSLPVIKVTSTTTNSDGYPADFVIHGTATDNVGVTNVFYQLNRGIWQTASTTNNWTNWTANVELSPGGNLFSAYAVDNSSNISKVFSAQIIYNSAPAKLAGQSAVATDGSGNSLFAIAFGKSTFSQVAQGTNNVNGVGSYTYAGNGGGGTLKLKYTGPPSATGAGGQTIGLGFYTPSTAYFVTTNTAGTNFGYMQFSSVSNLAPANISGQLIWSVGGQGDASGMLFQKTTYTSQALLSADTNAGSYTYTQYSPVGSLFKLTSTNGAAYVLASFANTNYGSYYEEDYDSSGHTNGTDNGNFVIASQMSGGNAPLTVTNRNLEIFSADGSFNEQFGADTYSQDTLDTNYDNAVGDYTYTRPDTNVGQLNLAATQPPTLAGANNAARLIFVGGNVGLFTNDDGTFSTFAMTAAANLAPASITNTTLSLGSFYSMQFAGDGSFIYYDFIFSYSGTYTYTPFSPGTAMVQLTYLDVSNNITGLDWLQLNFKATNSGNVSWNQFDSETNFLDNYNGAFSLP